MSFLSSPQFTDSVLAHNQFGLSLLQLLTQNAGSDTVFFSPLSVAAALALATAGAAGSTQTELATAIFGPGAVAADAEEALSAHLQKLTTAPDDGPVVLSVASSLWADQRFELAPAFVERALALYQAKASVLDFETPEAAATINAWTSEQTGGRIPVIVSPEELAGPPLAAAVLLSTVYFRGKWANEFRPANTQPGLFLQADGTVQKVPFMRQISDDFGYLAGDGWQAVAMPYAFSKHSFSMLVFVPDAGDGLPAFLATLDAPRWASWHQELYLRTEPVEVDLTLPRFQLQWGANLVPTLKNMGLATAFTPGADYEPMGFKAEKGGGMLTSVLHQAFLAVDEEGTEAAAATAVLAGEGCGARAQQRRVEVRVDSPFVCAIVDNRSGAILFAGAIGQLA